MEITKTKPKSSRTKISFHTKIEENSHKSWYFFPTLTAVHGFSMSSTILAGDVPRDLFNFHYFQGLYKNEF